MEKAIENFEDLSKEYINDYIERARKAQREFECYTQEQVDKIVKIVGKVVYYNAEYLAKLAVEETGITKVAKPVGVVAAITPCTNPIVTPMSNAMFALNGEANYQFFTEIFKMYSRKNPNGKITKCTKILADALECDPNCDVYGELEKFLNKLISKKALREYVMVESQIDEFTDSKIANQQRLLANNYVDLSREEIREIFANLY